MEDFRKELLSKRASIYSNDMVLSIGELVSMYDEDEINLEPAYQRLFRWEMNQKSDFIESILLGYPVPPIFVMQRGDGVWDVIDGLQRLSTIYQFVGILENEDPLEIGDVRILKSLIGKKWESNNPINEIDKATKIDFRRSGIPVNILKYESDPKAKYELFRRINTGSSVLSPAEVRSALILMFNESFFEAMEAYSENSIFNELINISDNQKNKKFDFEIITRFISYRYIDFDEVISRTNIDALIDDTIEKALTDNEIDLFDDLELFKSFINFLSENVSNDYGFKSFNKSTNSYQGQFQWFLFETLVFGLTIQNDFKKIKDTHKDEILETIKDLVSGKDYSDGKNLRVTERIKAANKYASEVFDFGTVLR